MRRYILRVVIAIVLLAALILASTRFSPWPAVLALRLWFDQDAARAMAALEPRLPPGLLEHPNLAYGADPRERLDLILPPGPSPPRGWPVILWVHGGAFVAGSKDNVANYLRLLAGDGYAAVVPNYTLAPTRRHPQPTAQMLSALLWVQASATDYSLDTSRIVLAGDSAGSHIALQTAIALHDPAYAHALNLRPRTDPANLRGLALFCGVYDLAGLATDGPFGGVLRSVIWAYLGHRDPADAPDAALFSLLSHLPPDLPPLFLTAGNADPLLPQTQALAAAVASRGLTAETLFFPQNHQPPLPHEYQFTLTPAGEQALARLRVYLARVTAP